MPRDAIQFYKIVKYSGIILGGLTVAAIVTLMILARGTGEDITGIVAPALLLTLVSAAAAIAAAVLQNMSERHRRHESNDLAG